MALRFDELDDDELEEAGDELDDEELAATGDQCRICGCTDAHACVSEDGTTCIWAAPGLCSFCAREAA